MKKKATIVVLAFSLVLCFAIGGSLAWLVDDTDPVTNIFSTSDINIDLTESDNLDLKMVPGNTITKDPKVTVEANSEACWLFVKVEKSANFDSFMDHAIDAKWTVLETSDDKLTSVYYCNDEELKNLLKEDKNFNILGAGSSDEYNSKTYSWNANEVFVLPTVTKKALNDLTTETMPTLSFTAYAVQLDGFNDDTKTDAQNAASAWAEIK